VAAFNSYIRNELKFGQDKRYEPLNIQANGAWTWTHQGTGGFGFPGPANTEQDLGNAMISNPHLQVEVENGYFDLATPFFESEYTMSHLGIPEKLLGNIHQKYYEAGHMMYVRDEDLTKLKTNIAAFIERASKP
jgi:carboxypeptidase C (cathepsin A)